MRMVVIRVILAETSKILCFVLSLALCADQWNVQATIQRTNESLIARGYVTWFDLTNMKGSTMDAMSDAIEGADVMLYGVSLAYKESANVCSWQAGRLICPQCLLMLYSRVRSLCVSVDWRPTTPTSRSWT